MKEKLRSVEDEVYIVLLQLAKASDIDRIDVEHMYIMHRLECSFGTV
jgi:hypothetical protein